MSTQTENEGAAAQSLYRDFDTHVYTTDVILRVCHAFTPRCFMTVNDQGNRHIRVTFTARNTNESLESIIGEFGNELINQRVRAQVAEETRTIRELIVAQAFAEADFQPVDT